MKKIQSLLSTSFLALFIFATTLLTSCSIQCKDKCKNGGTCEMVNTQYSRDPKCTCPAGYEGPNCEKVVRQKILGNYLVSGTDDNGGAYTNVNTSITASPTNISKIIIDVNGTFTLTCTMVLSTYFDVDSVAIAGYTYTGTGDFHYSGDNLSLSVTKTDGINMKVYTLSGTKQ